MLKYVQVRSTYFIAAQAAKLQDLHKNRHDIHIHFQFRINPINLLFRALINYLLLQTELPKSRQTAEKN